MRKQIDQFVQQQDTQPAAVPAEPTTAPALETEPAEAPDATPEALAEMPEPTPTKDAAGNAVQQPTVISPDAIPEALATVEPTPSPTPQPEVPETTPEVAPSEKPEQPVVEEAATEVAPEASTDNDNVNIAHKKIIQPPVEPMHPRPDLNELLAKEGINSFDEHPEVQQPTSPFNAPPHQPGHVISPNGAQDAPDLTAPVVTAPAPSPQPVTAAPNPNDPNNIAL
jgi:hypothetical protein